ncbi:MAG: tRNA preQ1(34) S-adenosylmethionine ribosyltransferase-isomerase QueA [Deltaproteobacteria bacterium]|nr:tRNA preQ1(34) S-adenosylmethionine ribosyltransferase-isomerase QueA [Candidatus Zymogenaceae bacterium]
MNLSDFDYDLPEELIAQHPPATRGGSRLMVLDRQRQTIEHCGFDDLTRFIVPGDLLVVNDTKVVAARVEGKKPTGGKVSVLFLEEAEGGATCLISGKGIRPQTTVILPGGIEAQIVGRDRETGSGAWRVSVRFPEGLFDYLETWGMPPLPPYIKRTDGWDPAADRDRYQTIYARDPGSVAAPTAGLHLTEEMTRRIREGGAHVAAVTLHVGIGTFLPIRTDLIEDHRMHAERYRIPPETARAIVGAKERGGRVIAVGTTTTRALEGAAAQQGNPTGDAKNRIEPGSGVTSLFITPGFRFAMVDALVTNFHLPRSTLLVLVSAFAGHRLIMDAYREAVRERYRFFSYGDAMLIL